MIHKVIEHFGSSAELARVLSVHRSAVSQWAEYGFLPPYRAVQVERITQGKFKAVDLVENKELFNE